MSAILSVSCHSWRYLSDPMIGPSFTVPKTVWNPMEGIKPLCSVSIPCLRRLQSGGEGSEIRYRGWKCSDKLNDGERLTEVSQGLWRGVRAPSPVVFLCKITSLHSITFETHAQAQPGGAWASYPKHVYQSTSQQHQISTDRSKIQYL